MASTTNIGDAVALVFEAIGGVSVTAEVIAPDGITSAPVPVDPSPSAPQDYAFTFIPDRVGVWRVRFRASGQAVATETYTVTVTDTATGPAPYATADTIATMWRDLSGDEIDRADTLCRYASAIIRTRVPGVDATIAGGRLPSAVAVYVCASMVLRVMRNPSGVAAETVGPWSVTYGSVGTQATGALYLTDEDLALLRGAAVGARSGTAKAVYQDSAFVPSRHRKPRAWGAER